MAKYSIYEAKTHFSKLLQKAEAGEEVVICNRDVPVAKLIPLPQEKKKSMLDFYGAFSGRIHIPEDFDRTPEGFEEYMP